MSRTDDLIMQVLADLFLYIYNEFRCPRLITLEIRTPNPDART